MPRGLGHARRGQAGQLARNVAFTSALMESGVEFVCCDNPHANRLTIHILAAVARTKLDGSPSARSSAGCCKEARREAGCRQAGVPKPVQRREKGARAAGEAVRRKADEAYQDLRELFTALRPTAHFRRSRRAESAGAHNEVWQTVD